MNQVSEIGVQLLFFFVEPNIHLTILYYPPYVCFLTGKDNIGKLKLLWKLNELYFCPNCTTSWEGGEIYIETQHSLTFSKEDNSQRPLQSSSWTLTVLIMDPEGSLDLTLDIHAPSHNILWPPVTVKIYKRCLQGSLTLSLPSLLLFFCMG